MRFLPPEFDGPPIGRGMLIDDAIHVGRVWVALWRVVLGREPTVEGHLTLVAAHRYLEREARTWNALQGRWPVTRALLAGWNVVLLQSWGG